VQLNRYHCSESSIEQGPIHLYLGADFLGMIGGWESATPLPPGTVGAGILDIVCEATSERQVSGHGDSLRSLV
jgi:hypothetical protein